MSFTIALYKFTKRGPESTKRPTGTGSQLTGELKEPSSIMAPTIIFSSSVFSDPTAYNYAYISKFNRYYFITDIRWILGRWEVSMRCDVLATYKSEIGSKSMYMLRAAGSSNGAIIDHFYPITVNKTTDGEILEMDDISLGSGCYVVNIMGSVTGSSTLYLFAPADFTAFLRALLAEVANVTGLNFSQAAVNAIYEPLQYIKSVIWLPLSYAEASAAFGVSSGGTVHAGLWDSQVGGNVLNTGAAPVRSYAVTLPKHPQAASRGKFLNSAPFTEYIIDYEPFGCVSLDASRLVDDTTLTITIYADAVTGIGIMKAGGNDSGPVLSLTAQYGVPVPLSGAASNFSAIASLLTSAATTAAGLATGNIALAGSGTAAGIGSLGDVARGIVSTAGSAGSMAAWQTGKTFGAIFHTIASEDNAEHGRPLCAVATPESLGGYCLPKDAHVDIPGTSEEQTEIARICEGGFFYE